MKHSESHDLVLIL